MKSKKTWREKVEEPQGKIVDMPAMWVKRYGEGKLLIPKPLDIDDLIRKTRKGKLITHGQIREILAQRHEAQATCPLTTGIFVWLISEKAEEDFKSGKLKATPYWRVVRDDGSLNPKFPGGAAAQAKRLRAEGHTIEPGRGKKPPTVRDYAKRLIGVN